MRDMPPGSPRHEGRRHEPSATAVEQYLGEIRRYTALTRDEAASLARRIRERDRDALDTLVRPISGSSSRSRGSIATTARHSRMS